MAGFVSLVQQVVTILQHARARPADAATLLQVGQLQELDRPLACCEEEAVKLAGAQLHDLSVYRYVLLLVV